MRGVEVAWGVTEGSGSVAPVTSRTDTAGRAEAAWTLGTKAGLQVAEAQVAGLGPVRFKARAIAGRATQVQVPDTVRFTALAQSRVVPVAVFDAHGNRVESPNVRWSHASGSGSPFLVKLMHGNEFRSDSQGTTRMVASVEGAADTVVLVALRPQHAVRGSSARPHGGAPKPKGSARRRIRRSLRYIGSPAGDAPGVSASRSPPPRTGTAPADPMRRVVYRPSRSV